MQPAKARAFAHDGAEEVPGVLAIGADERGAADSAGEGEGGISHGGPGEVDGGAPGGHANPEKKAAAGADEGHGDAEGQVGVDAAVEEELPGWRGRRGDERRRRRRRRRYHLC